MKLSVFSPWPRAVVLLAATLAVAACDNQGPPSELPPERQVERPVQQPAPGTAPAPLDGTPQADARGIVTYPDYQVVVARQGDTVATIASRVGLPAGELASYNGLPADWVPRQGDNLVLPPRPGGYGTTTATARPVIETAPATPAPNVWSPELAEAAIDSAPGTETTSEPRVAPLSSPATDPLPEPIAPAVTADPAPTTPEGPRTSSIEPLRHIVAPGETIYSISRLYDVKVSAIAAWNGIGRDLTLRPGQEVMIPIAGITSPTSPTVTAPTVTQPTPVAPESPVIASPVTVEPGQTQPISTPPSAEDPLPPTQPRAEIPASPNLEQYRTETDTPTKLLKPVRGEVMRPYSRLSATRNDGIDFRADAGEPVLASDGGEIALVSNSLGGLGKIVLIRHAAGITTVYGRVDGVTVRKGDIVARGQVIGTVAAARNPSLHFEVRKGAQSVDPAPYL